MARYVHDGSVIDHVTPVPIHAGDVVVQGELVGVTAMKAEPSSAKSSSKRSSGRKTRRRSNVASVSLRYHRMPSGKSTESATRSFSVWWT